MKLSRILFSVATFFIAAACVAQAPQTTPAAKPMTEEQRLQLANPNAAATAPGGNAAAQSQQAAPLPWGGVPMTEDQRLRLENAQLKIQNMSISARAQYQVQLQQQVAPFLEDRRTAAAEVLKTQPDWSWDDAAGTFRKKAVTPEVPEAPSPAAAAKPRADIGTPLKVTIPPAKPKK